MAVEDHECPVCMERTVDDRVSVWSFGCSHAICKKCDEQLFVRADDRCPMCRSPRTEESKARRLLCGADALCRSQAMMERAQNDPQTTTVFFPSVGVEEVTIQQTLLIRPPVHGEDDSSDSPGVMVTVSDHPIMQDPAIQHVVRALTTVGTISEFFQATDELRSRGVFRSFRRVSPGRRPQSETTVRTYVVVHNAR